VLQLRRRNKRSKLRSDLVLSDIFGVKIKNLLNKKILFNQKQNYLSIRSDYRSSDFFFNFPTTPILLFVQENQQLYHYFFLPSLTWRTQILTVPAVHPKQKTTTFGLCFEDCYEEKKVIN